MKKSKEAKSLGTLNRAAKIDIYIRKQYQKLIILGHLQYILLGCCACKTKHFKYLIQRI